ncbi:MAG: YoaK family protein [Lachnospiraceae bacterium]|nr:YoaK family protein [Lachnospiraceae bacterium]
MKTKQQMYNRFLHHNMAIVGGFLAGYSVLMHSNFLGNAQTSNLIFLFFSILKRDPMQALLRFLGVLLYVSGGIAFVFVKNKTRYDVRAVSMFITSLMIFILGLMPEDIDIVIGLFPAFFAMAFQWNSFPGEYGYVSSTIFSTNNTRQVSLALGEILFPNDGKKGIEAKERNRQHWHKAVFFMGSLLGFHIGVVVSYLFVQQFGIKAIWFDWIFIVTGIILLIKEKKI